MVAWLASCFVAYLAGALGGYAKGTKVSTVLAAQGMAGNRAVHSAALLSSFKEGNSDVARKMYEDGIKQDLIMYYLFKDADAKESNLFRRFNYFDPIALPSLRSVAHFLRQRYTEKELKEVEVYSRVLQDYEERN